MDRAAGFRALIVALVLVGANCSLALADDLDSLVKKGIELRRQGKESEALELFHRAAEIKRTPRVIAQVALAEQALGMWIVAERDLKEALGNDRDTWINKNSRLLGDALRIIQGHLGSLEVLGKPNGAEILADGEVVGTLPTSTPVRLPIGSISLTVRKEGYDKVTRIVEILRDALARENITLHLAPDIASPRLSLHVPASSTASASGETAHPILTTNSTQEVDQTSRPIYRRWWFWTAIAVVAASAGAGAYLATRSNCPKGVTCTSWGN